MIKFGTSGFRGVMGENFTEDIVQKIAAALSKIIKEEKVDHKIVIGFDNRLNGRLYAERFCEALDKNIKVLFYTESAPSPAIAFQAKTNYTVAITASHNPHYYNGIKIFMPGSKECDSVFCKKLENIANHLVKGDIKTTSFTQKVKNKTIVLSTDFSEYCNHVLSFVDIDTIRKSKIHPLFNPMHGNGTGCINSLFEKLEIKYDAINTNIDPTFGGKVPAPYIYNLTEQALEIKKKKYSFGFALDGDSDRFTFIDKDGKIYDGNYYIPVLYYFFIKYKGKKGGIAKNYALSELCRKIAHTFCQNCYEEKVGFKNIGYRLENSNAFMGGETNGLCYKDNILIKDGIFTTLAIIDMLAITKKSFGQLLKEVQKLTNFKSCIIEFAYPISNEKKEELYKFVFVDKNIPTYKRKIKSISYEDCCKITDQGYFWGVIRFSGNESVVRIFSEMKNLKECNKMIACYEKFLKVKDRQH